MHLQKCLTFGVHITFSLLFLLLKFLSILEYLKIWQEYKCFHRI